MIFMLCHYLYNTNTESSLCLISEAARDSLSLLEVGISETELAVDAVIE